VKAVPSEGGDTVDYQSPSESYSCDCGTTTEADLDSAGGVAEDERQSRKMSGWKGDDADDLSEEDLPHS